jgi:hypothetical protein
MFLGRPFIFQCDFCKIILQKIGYGLPDGMKWIAGNYLKDQQLRHICAECIAKEAHGEEKLHDSGKQ